jgi:hypothetical protein
MPDQNKVLEFHCDASMEDAADTITYMVVAAVWCECRRKKCKGAVLIVSMSPQALPRC